MTRRFLLIGLFCSSIQAQFENLVTTDDGSTLLFQSTWRLAGLNDADLQKIFPWDAKGFSQVFSPANPGLAPGFIGMYQVDIALPVDIPAGQFTFSCVDQFPPIGVIGDSGPLFVAAH